MMALQQRYEDTLSRKIDAAFCGMMRNVPVDVPDMYDIAAGVLYKVVSDLTEQDGVSWLDAVEAGKRYMLQQLRHLPPAMHERTIQTMHLRAYGFVENTEDAAPAVIYSERIEGQFIDAIRRCRAPRR
jgi:hypothetical protein